MSSRTSLGQRNELRMARSNISSGFNLSNQVSSKRLSAQFPIQTYINIYDQLNAIHIYQKCTYFHHYSADIKLIQNTSLQKQSFKGEIKNGKKEGFGSYMYKNNDQYIGYWENDKIHGMGIYQYDNGNSNERYVYIGEFSQGSFNGIGKLIWLGSRNQKVGSIVYQGFWENGEKNGYGIYFYAHDTSVYYQGYWLNDKKHGQGRLLFKNGQYSGLWLNDKKHGQGKLRIQRSQYILIYQGQWTDDELNLGQITYLSNNSQSIKQGHYKGQIRNGKKDGQGIFQYKNIFLKGIFDNDYFTGKGTLYNNLYSIQGDFLTPKAALKGKIKYTNGDVYEGAVEIVNGLIRRKVGEYSFKNGDLAKGQFNDIGSGQLIGLFEYLWNNGEKKKFDN